MAGFLQPLDQKFPVVNSDGTPTDYFTRWAQQRMDDIVAAATADQVTAAIDTWAAARLINTASPILGGGSLAADLNLSHATSGVVAGSYTNANITVNADGHVTAAANGTGGGGGTVTTTGTPAAGNLTKFSGASSITNGDLSGDISTSGTLVTTIGAGKVTLAKMANVATGTVFYRKTAGTGVPQVQTLATLKTDLAIVAADVGGLGYFATGTNAANLTGTVAAAQLPAMTGGDVTSPAGSAVLTIGAAAVTLAKMANVASGTIFYRKTAGAGDPEVQTLATLKADLALTAGDISGLGYFATGTNAANLTGTIPAAVLAATLADQIAVALILGTGVVLAQSAVQVSHTGDLLEFALATVAIPANAMGANGRIEIRARLTATTTAATTLKLKLGAVTIFTRSATLAVRNLVGEIANRNATNSQVGGATDTSGTASATNSVLTGAANTTTALNFQLTATLANIGDTITLEDIQVILYPKA